MPAIDVNGLRQKRAEKIDAMEKIMATAQAEERDVLEEEQLAFDELEAEVEALKKQIELAEKVQKLKAQTAKAPRMDLDAQAHGNGHGMDVSGKQYPQPKEALPKGVTFARFVKSLASAKGMPRIAAQIAEERYGDGEVAKALAAADGSAGGFLVPENSSQDIIDLLRPRSVVRSAGARTIPMQGTLLIPKHTATSVAAYVGENQNITKTEPQFGQIRMTERKLAGVVPISNDLIRNASPRADEIVRDDLVASMAVTEDAAFLRSQGTGNAPRGLRYWGYSGNITATAGTSAANIETDLKTLVQGLEGADVAMLNPVWIMAPRSKNHLYTLRDAGGNLVFPEVRDGRLWGYPIFVTNNVPTNLGGGANETELYFVDMNDVLIGEASQISIDVSSEAAYHDGSQVVAAFSQDQTVIRAIMRHDLAVRYDRSIAVKTGVTWGAV